MKTEMIFDDYLIRLICIEDLDAYYNKAFKNPDEEVMYYTGTVGSFNKEQIKNYLLKVIDDSTRKDFIITRNSEIIGEVVLSDISNKTCHYRICIFRSENFSKGIGQKATRLVFDYLFKELNLECVELEVFPFNQRGIAVYSKLGFVEDERIVDEEAEEPYRDIIVMRLSKENYYTF